MRLVTLRSFHSQVTIGSKQIAVPGDDAKIALVMTESNKDPEEWRAFIGNKTRRQELAARFKDNDSPLKIAIVVDMWLTGFDVPSLATMYVYKPMESYNLMQAIARVNRVFKGYPFPALPLPVSSRFQSPVVQVPLCLQQEPAVAQKGRGLVPVLPLLCHSSVIRSLLLRVSGRYIPRA